jgi:hypothetical protein
LVTMFSIVELIRSRLLTLLRPFNIAKLLSSTQCELSRYERQRDMDVTDGIFKDNTDFTVMRSLRMTIRLFRSDLEVVERRLQHPRTYLERFRSSHTFHIFMLVSGSIQEEDSKSELLQDFQP